MVAVGVSLALLTSPQTAYAAADYGVSDPNSLEPFDGDLTVRLDGQVVENLEIRGTLWIAANDVVVRNVWVYSESAWTVYVEEGSATFENVEIGHPDFIGERGIGGRNVTARLLDIHHVEDGIKLGDDSTYEQVHVHDLDSLSPDPHADAIQADGGSSNVMVRDSVLDSTGPLGTGNAAVLLKSDLGPIDGVILDGNHLNGGAYTIFVRDGGNGYPTNVTFTDNTFGPDFKFGLADIPGSVAWSGNTFEGTGQDLEPDGTLSETGSAPEISEPTSGVTSTLAPSTTMLGSQREGNSSEPPAAAPEPSEEPSTAQWATGLLVAFLLGALSTSIWSMRRRSREDAAE